MSNPKFLHKDDILKNIYLGCISSYVPHHYPRVKTQYHSVLRYQPFRPRTKTFKLINILNLPHQLLHTQNAFEKNLKIYSFEKVLSHKNEKFQKSKH